MSGKPSNCPIIELPPHGRLIDADALMQKYERLIKQGDISPRSGAYVKVFLADAPTIIEAEENKSLKDRLAECDASDLFPELTEEEKAENKRLAHLCNSCRWSPPTSFDGRPCCACDPSDPLMSAYEPEVKP